MKPEDAKVVSALQATWRAGRETELVDRDLATGERDEKHHDRNWQEPVAEGR